MKEILCLSLLFTTNAFAIDFQKVTGSFDLQTQKEKSVGVDTVANAAYGSFDMNDTGRVPASAEEKRHTPDSHVTEMTGTFNAR